MLYARMLHNDFEDPLKSLPDTVFFEPPSDAEVVAIHRLAFATAVSEFAWLRNRSSKDVAKDFAEFLPYDPLSC